MIRRLHLTFAAAILVLVAAPSLVRAQVVTYTWTGLGNDPYFTFSGNWLNGTLPLADLDNTHLVFGNRTHRNVLYWEFFANQVRIEGNTRAYNIVGGFDTLHLGSGGLIYDPAGTVRSVWDDNVQLEAAQTWDIRGGTFELEGVIAGAHSITKSGAGTLELADDDSLSWSGGLTLSAGRVGIQATDLYFEPISKVLGTGVLIFNGGTLASRYNENDENGDPLPVILVNDVVSNGAINTENEVPLHLNAASQITLAADTTINTSGQPLHLGGTIVESGGVRSLTLNGPGTLVIEGGSGWTGATIVNGGALIFAGEDNTPGTPGSILIGPNGYAGITSDQNTGGALTQLNAASTGSFGFDSTNLDFPDTFTTAIDLTGQNTSLRLGSATAAILSSTAVITPPAGTGYRFGGGGGYLIVQSALTDGAGARSLSVVSPADRPLLVELSASFNANTYSGGTSVTHSGLIFGSDNAPGGTGNITVNQGGYVGFRFWGDQSTQQLVDNTLVKFNSASTGMIGFDGFGSIGANINLTGFTNPLHLGTATALELTGTITPQGTTYRFGAYRGGELTVSSTLSGAGNTVVVGDPDSLGSMGDFANEQYSTVELRGNNTYGGGTTLFAGELLVGQTNGVIGVDPTTALGTGALVVATHNLSLPDGQEDVRAQLTLDSGVILPNAIQLTADLNIGGNDSNGTLSGPITGAGTLHLDGEFTTITLSGNNTHTGGVYLGGFFNSLRLANNTASGTGAIGFGGSPDGIVYFETAAPVIGGIASADYSSIGTFYAEMADTILTINQGEYARFNGEFRSLDSSESLRLVKAGIGTLHLESGGLYARSGPTEPALAGTEVTIQVNAGTLVIHDSFDLGETVSNFPPFTPTTIWVNGGTLALADDAQVFNPLVVSSGRLAGQGFFKAATLGPGAIVSPGLLSDAAVATLAFDDLTLGGGGLYEWNLIAADPTLPGGADLITVEDITTLTISATALDPFVIKLITLQPDGTPGTVTGFTGDRSYTWTLFNATNSTIVGFDPAKFSLDTSQFLTDAVPYTFALSQNGNLIQLTFQAVPEPSTYALFATGLGLVVLTVRRRRRVQ